MYRSFCGFLFARVYIKRSCFSLHSSGRMSITDNLKFVREKIRLASSSGVPVRLVAVSKTKPVSAVIEAYLAGQKEFGENYVHELLEKANDPQLLQACPDIRWHFIGTLQRNKAAKLARLAQLSVVETVDSERLADTLNDSRGRAGLSPLRVMVQVNTSGESNKGGVSVADTLSLVRHVTDRCPLLQLTGLMTIGAYSRDMSLGPNPDFQALVQCRAELCGQLGWQPDALELSMGMSTDYEHAIHLGSTNVRVGSVIFGARVYSQTKTAHTAAPAEQQSSDATSGDGDAKQSG